MMIVTYCVQHFNELWEIVQPARCCHLEDNMTYTDEISFMCKSVITSWDVRVTYPQSLRWFRVVDQVTAKWISSPPSWHYELREWENSWIKSLNDLVDNLIRTLIIAIDKTFRIQITMNACLSNSWGRGGGRKKKIILWTETHFIDHVDRESHYTEVVEDEDSFQVQRFAVLHYPRPKRCHKVNVCRDDDRLWKWRRHKEPVPCPRVFKEKKKYIN